MSIGRHGLERGAGVRVVPEMRFADSDPGDTRGVRSALFTRGRWLCGAAS